jgi:hypothetical protein
MGTRVNRKDRIRRTHSKARNVVPAAHVVARRTAAWPRPTSLDARHRCVTSPGSHQLKNVCGAAGLGRLHETVDLVRNPLPSRETGAEPRSDCGDQYLLPCPAM